MRVRKRLYCCGREIDTDGVDSAKEIPRWIGHIFRKYEVSQFVGCNAPWNSEDSAAEKQSRPGYIIRNNLAL